jgi:hypothetical protein
MEFALHHGQCIPLNPGENVGEVVRFVSKSELERARLIREARAIYDSIFPPAEPARDEREREEAPSIQS